MSQSHVYRSQQLIKLAIRPTRPLQHDPRTKNKNNILFFIWLWGKMQNWILDPAKKLGRNEKNLHE